jgi:hypothetical protein
MKSIYRSILARSLMTGAASLAVMTIGPPGVRAETVIGAIGPAGANCPTYLPPTDATAAMPATESRWVPPRIRQPRSAEMAACPALATYPDLTVMVAPADPERIWRWAVRDLAMSLFRLWRWAEGAVSGCLIVCSVARAVTRAPTCSVCRSHAGSCDPHALRRRRVSRRDHQARRA